MQGEAQVHAEPRAQALLQARVPAVARQCGRLVHTGEDPREGDEREVGQALAEEALEAVRAPDDEEGVAHVLVDRSVVLVDDAVNDLRNLVHELHDLALKDLGREAEVPDPGVADDALHAAAWDHRVDARAVQAAHVVAHDVRARLPEAQGQQGAQLDDCLLENESLHGLLALGGWEICLDEAVPTLEPLVEEFVATGLQLGFPVLDDLLQLELGVGHLQGYQRVVCDRLHLLHHPLHRLEHQGAGVAGEEERADAEDDADEEGGDQREHGLLACEGPLVEEEDQVPIVELDASEQLRVHAHGLRRPEV
mmetsp:Transcript_54176/g.167965  ORF Transcript_54176/g.167965 Transcript_54176/m.167965 type:complete len:309 (-) Transcript_54176:324-1250(-)